MQVDTAKRGVQGIFSWYFFSDMLSVYTVSSFCQLLSHALFYMCDNVFKMEKSDEQLIADALSEDDDAFPELLSRYLKPVYNFVRRLSGSDADAEDISQEVFVKVWKNLKKYRQGESVRAWIFSVARSTTIDWLRKRKHLLFSDFENAEGENPLLATLTAVEP